MPDLDPLRRALESSPDNIPLLLLYGQGCLEEWSLPEAESTFLRVLACDGRNLDARLGLANVLSLSGRGSEAIVRLEALLAEQPRNARAYLLLARVQLAEGDVREARSSFRRARELDPALSDPGLERDLGSERRRSVEGAVPQQSSMGGEESDDKSADFFAGMEEDFPGLEDESVFGLEDIEHPDTKFSDVAGLEAIKKELAMLFVHPLARPDLFRSYGKAAGGGVLLYGPPGCGKSLVARAAAGEAGAKLMSILPHQILDMFIGNSEKNLHQVFQLARQQAPVVLFFDEVDALATDRRETRGTVPRSLIQQFLAELDALSSMEGVLVIAATNAPWMMDSAFRRAGRFDRALLVPAPDLPAREALLRMLAADKPVAAIDFARLAAATEGFTGTDLVQLFDRVVEAALAKAMEGSSIVPLETDGFLTALATMTPSAPGWMERFEQG